MALRRSQPLVLAALLFATVGPARATPSPAVQPYAPLNDAFHAYGDAGAAWQSGQPRTWTGADTTFSVPLPDGRNVWIFSDSFLSPTNGCGVDEEGVCHRRKGFQGFVNNTFVVEKDGALVQTLAGGTDAQPQALITPPAPANNASFYWMGDGTVEGNKLRVFVHRYPLAVGTIPPQIATDVATFSTADMRLRSITEGVSSDAVRPWAMTPGHDSPIPVIWGAGVMEDGDYTYIYGTEEYSLFKYLHVARVPRGHLLDAPWGYWDGSAWAPDAIASVRVLGDVAGELSVGRTADGYRLIASRGGIGDIYMYSAPHPQGPWDAGIDLYKPPEVARGASVYNAHEHPEFNTPGKFVVSYNVNGSLDGNDVYNDVHVYRPRFIEVTL